MSFKLYNVFAIASILVWLVCANFLPYLLFCFKLVMILNVTGLMELSLLKVLLSNISSFLRLSSLDNINVDPVQKYYQRVEEILKLLKPILDAIVDSEIASSEVFNKVFQELAQSIDELREIFESWQTLSSKVYFVS